MILQTRRKATIAALAAAVVAAVVFYGLHDPTADGLAPRCMFKTLGGYDCPGCGFQRAMHAMLHGDFAAAWHYNAFLFFMLPVGLAYLVCELWPKRWKRLQKTLFSPLAIIFIIVLTTGWWIGRNL